MKIQGGCHWLRGWCNSSLPWARVLDGVKQFPRNAG